MAAVKTTFKTNSHFMSTEFNQITPAARIIVAELILQEAIDELPDKS